MYVDTLGITEDSETMEDGKLVILGLIPKNVWESTSFKLFWKYTKTLYKNILPVIESGEVPFKMNDIEKLFTGLISCSERDRDFIVDYSEKLLVLTRFFNSSVGPRKGDFFEALIENWLKNAGYIAYRGAVLKDILRIELSPDSWKDEWNEVLGKSRLDFFLKKYDTISLVELRMSEDTGGKTGQQSLLDKFNGFLSLMQDPDFIVALRKSSVKRVELVIETVFSENDKTIVNEPSQGRFTSLVNYIAKEEHLYGKIKKLLKNTSRKEFEAKLRQNRKFEFEFSSLNVSIILMYGNEFFSKYLNEKLEHLLNTKEIPDDIWLLYSIAVNELLRMRISENGKTLTREVYDILLTYAPEEIEKLFEEFAIAKRNSRGKTVKFFVDYADKVTDRIRQLVLELVEKNNISLQIFPSSDFQKSYRYLKYIAYLILLIGCDRKKIQKGVSK